MLFNSKLSEHAYNKITIRDGVSTANQTAWTAFTADTVYTAFTTCYMFRALNGFMGLGAYGWWSGWIPLRLLLLLEHLWCWQNGYDRRNIPALISLKNNPLVIKSHPCWIWCWNSMFWICTKYFNKCKDIFRSKLILYGCLINFGSMIYQDTYAHILSISMIWMWFEIKRKTLFVVFSEICCPTAPRIPLSIKTLELWRIFKEKIFLRWTVICLFSSCFSL